MTTNRSWRTREAREAVSPGVREYLLTGDRGGSIETFMLDDDDARKVWESVKDELVADHVKRSPGTRPWGWWRWTAPRAVADPSTPAWIAERMVEPRRRISGKGTPKHEVLNFVPSFNRGVPDHWVSVFEVAYYNGRAVDIHGKRIGEKYEEGHFPYQAIDRDDPPVFESEASYLKRLGLLLPGEKARLSPDDFTDERIGPEDDE